MSAAATILGPTAAETAVQLLEPDQFAKLSLLSGEVADVMRLAEPLVTRKTPLETSIEAHTLNNLMGRGAKAFKELEALRDARVRPLNKEVDNVNALFGLITGVLKKLSADGKRRILAWNDQEAARIQREQAEARRRQEEAARKEAAALARINDAASAEEIQRFMVDAEQASREQAAAVLAEPQAAPRAYKSEEATSFTTEKWVPVVVDAALVPRSFCVPDMGAIKAAVAGGVREIPGVAITLEKGLTTRTR